MPRSGKAPIPNQKQVTSCPCSRLRLGSRLLADAYAGDGNLLIRAGAEVDTDSRLNRLLQPDVRFGPDRSPEIPIDLESEAKLDEEVSNKELDTAEFRKSIEHARSIKDEVVEDITEVFGRIESSGKVEVRFAEKAVSALVGEMLDDPRALVSLTQLKDADSYTFTHSVNVSILSIYLAMHSGLIEDMELVGTSALLHDIGKLRIPAAILNKPGDLSHEEHKAIRSHPELGVGVLQASGGFCDEVHCAVLDHHEKFNGTGYPNHKNSGGISRHARLISIADVYDALTTDRPYRKAMDPREAMLLMTGHMSKGFDPTLLKRFVAAVGYFPVGSKVKLSDGSLAVVVRNHPSDPLRPAVEIVRDVNGNTLSPALATDLRVEKDVFVARFIKDKTTQIRRAA